MAISGVGDRVLESEVVGPVSPSPETEDSVGSRGVPLVDVTEDVPVDVVLSSSAVPFSLIVSPHESASEQAWVAGSGVELDGAFASSSIALRRWASGEVWVSAVCWSVRTTSNAVMDACLACLAALCWANLALCSPVGTAPSGRGALATSSRKIRSSLRMYAETPVASIRATQYAVSSAAVAYTQSANVPAERICARMSGAERPPTFYTLYTRSTYVA
jgi:hypothetical protein